MLDVSDHAYFGYFNLKTLRAMRALQALELRVHTGVKYSWGTGQPADDILRDFTAEVTEWPEWEVPELIRIVQAETGDELCVIRGRGDLVVEEEKE